MVYRGQEAKVSVGYSMPSEGVPVARSRVPAMVVQHGAVSEPKQLPQGLMNPISPHSATCKHVPEQSSTDSAYLAVDLHFFSVVDLKSRWSSPTAGSQLLLSKDLHLAWTCLTMVGGSANGSDSGQKLGLSTSLYSLYPVMTKTSRSLATTHSTLRNAE